MVLCFLGFKSIGFFWAFLSFLTQTGSRICFCDVVRVVFFRMVLSWKSLESCLLCSLLVVNVFFFFLRYIFFLVDFQFVPPNGGEPG